jgi:hypothetical protein
MEDEMVWLIDGYGMKRWLSNRGWRRVVLSQRVWERCVAVPEGVRGQSVDIRLWDLLTFLGDGIGSNPATPRRYGNRVDFYAGVVNDNRDECDDDSRDWPTTKQSLVARAGVADDGSPCLIVTLRGECSLR